MIYGAVIEKLRSCGLLGKSLELVGTGYVPARIFLNFILS